MAIEFRSHRQQVFDPIKNFAIYRDGRFYDLKKTPSLIYSSGDFSFIFEFEEIVDFRDTIIDNIRRQRRVAIGVKVFEKTVLKGVASSLVGREVSSDFYENVKNNIANGLSYLINCSALDAPLVSDFFVEFSSAEI